MSHRPPDEPQPERSGEDPQQPSWPRPGGEQPRDLPQYPYPPNPAQQPSWAPQPPTGGYAPGGYPAQAHPVQPTPASTVVLLVLSGLATVSCWFTLAGIAPLILSIIALTRQRSDPAATRRLTKIGWIVLAVGVAVLVLAGAAFLVAAVVQSPTSSS